MAAEKLTKARLVQILIIMAILVTAFSWRTIQHSKQESFKVNCQIGQTCLIKTKQGSFNILFDSQITQQQLVITMSPTQNKQPELWISSEAFELNKTQLTANQPIKILNAKLNQKNMAFIAQSHDQHIKINLMP